MTQHRDPTDPMDATRAERADSAGTMATTAATQAGPAEPVEQRFWINTVSLEHVAIGVAGGFVQADHGKPTRLRWLRRGDWIVMYSPRERMRAGAAVQAFTALGVIADVEPYQVRLGPDFEPWRRRVQWQPCAAAAVRPLLGDLTFVIDKAQWGYPFRRGLFRVDRADFTRIASTMAPDSRGRQSGERRAGHGRGLVWAHDFTAVGGDRPRHRPERRERCRRLPLPHP